MTKIILRKGKILLIVKLLKIMIKNTVNNELRATYVFTHSGYQQLYSYLELHTTDVYIDEMLIS